MARTSKPATRRKGVTVSARAGAHGTRFTARYTLPGGTRAYIPAPVDSWDEAFRAACALQDKAERGGYRSVKAHEMTFAELAHSHFLPRYDGPNVATMTRRNVRSHMGDGTGRPARKGAKNERGARFALLFRFGTHRLNDIGPSMISSWQDAMVAEGYEHSSILAKRSILRNALEMARVNNWLDGANPVDAVPRPLKRAKEDDERWITPEEWGLIRAHFTGEGTTLLFDVTLDTGLRFEEITGLRPIDVRDPSDTDPPHLWIRNAIVWPGRKYTNTDLAYESKEPKGRRFRKVAVTGDVHRRLLAYIEQWQITPTALIFDQGRLRAEHAEMIDKSGLPKRFPKGRYVNEQTGRSGAHGKYTTYNLGCRCPFCRNAYTEYRFWWRRRTGRSQDARPWMDPHWIASRGDAYDPVPHSWLSQSVWKKAVRAAELEWEPTPHDLRHARATWGSEYGEDQRELQLNMGHASQSTTEIYKHRALDRIPATGLDAMAKAYARMNGVLETQPDQGSDPVRVALEAWFATLSTEQAALLMTQTLQSSTVQPDLRVVADGAQVGRP
jgi:integrase